MGTDLPDVIVRLNQVVISTDEMRVEEKERSVTDSVEAMCYKEKELQDDQIDKHKEVWNIDDNVLDTGW